jgi:hypothetical protein
VDVRPNTAGTRLTEHRLTDTDGKVEPREDPLRLGYPPSGQRLRPGHKRSGDALLPGVPVRIYRYAEPTVSPSCVDLNTDSDPEDFDPGLLPPEAMSAVEADTFWCLSRLLDGIQDNYIAGQPGIQRSVRRMSELVGRIDRACTGAPNLIDPHACAFLSSVGGTPRVSERRVHAVRVPMDELPLDARDQRREHHPNVGHLPRPCSHLRLSSRLTQLQAEGTEAFSQFHLYVCAAFLVRWSDKLQDMDFQVLSSS